MTPKKNNPGPIRTAPLWAVLVLVVGACAAPTVPADQPGPEGRLTVLAPARAIDLNAPAKDWIISGATPPGRALSSVIYDGVPALEFKSGPGRVIAVRQVNAMMLATPFLGWSWNLSDAGPAIHPLRLVIGFQGGAPAGTALGGAGRNLPDHDRALALVWGDTALRRGSLSLPPPDKPFQTPLYTVRGGRENTRKWWNEAVDLADLYARAWPNDVRKRVRITFIGIATAPTQTVVRGRVARISLTR